MKQISHNINDESMEAKVRWFRTLTLSEKMDMLCEFKDLALELNPDLAEKKDAGQEYIIWKDGLKKKSETGI